MGLQKIAWPAFYVTINFILLLSGFAQLITSICVIIYSSAFYIGGIYSAATALWMGFRGFTIRKRGWYYADGLSMVIMVITALVAMIVMSIVNNFLSDLEACSVYTDSESNTCNSAIYTHYDCYGNSNYFPAAEFCAIDNTVSYGADDQDCVCVNGQDSTCYVVSKIKSCSNLINLLPKSAQISLIFAVISFVSSLLLFFIMMISLLCKRSLGLDQQQENEEEIAGGPREALLPVPATVVYASAPSDPAYSGQTASSVYSDTRV